MANVNYTIAGNATSAERAVDRLRARFDRLEQRMAQASRRSRTNSRRQIGGLQQVGRQLGQLALQWGSVSTAINLAQGVFRKFLADFEKIQQLRQQISETLPVVELRVAQQGELNESEINRLRRSIEEQFRRRPVQLPIDAYRTSEELISQGFNREQVLSGDALREFQDLQVVTNQFGAERTDPKEIVKSLATAIRNGRREDGLDPDVGLRAQDIANFRRDFVALFAARPIQLQDAIPFARIRATLNARGISNVDEQLAAFTVALERQGSADEAATGLKQTTAFLRRTATRTLQNALKKKGLNLDTEGFDLIGEDLDDALESLANQLGTLSPREQTEALNTIFGTRAQSAALNLINSVEDIRAAREEILRARQDDSIEANRIQLFDQSIFRRNQLARGVQDFSVFRGLQSERGFREADADAVLNTLRERLEQAGDRQALRELSSREFIEEMTRVIEGGRTARERLEFLGEQSAFSLEDLFDATSDGPTPQERIKAGLERILREIEAEADVQAQDRDGDVSTKVTFRNEENPPFGGPLPTIPAGATTDDLGDAVLQVARLPGQDFTADLSAAENLVRQAIESGVTEVKFDGEPSEQLRLLLRELQNPVPADEQLGIRREPLRQDQGSVQQPSGVITPDQLEVLAPDLQTSLDNASRRVEAAAVAIATLPPADNVPEPQEGTRVPETSVNVTTPAVSLDTPELVVQSDTSGSPAMPALPETKDPTAAIREQTGEFTASNAAILSVLNSIDGRLAPQNTIRRNQSRVVRQA